MNRDVLHSLDEDLTSCKFFFDANVLKFQLGRIVVTWHQQERSIKSYRLTCHVWGTQYNTKLSWCYYFVH
jgi:hypothetical protein